MTYPELVEFCGDEGQAYFLSTKLPYQRMSESQLTDAVLALLVRVAERAHHRAQFQLEYIGGQRRDIIRRQLA
jgi:hypothetical protein